MQRFTELNARTATRPLPSREQSPPVGRVRRRPGGGVGSQEAGQDALGVQPGPGGGEGQLMLADGKLLGSTMPRRTSRALQARTSRARTAVVRWPSMLGGGGPPQRDGGVRDVAARPARPREQDGRPGRKRAGGLAPHPEEGRTAKVPPPSSSSPTGKDLNMSRDPCVRPGRRRHQPHWRFSEVKGTNPGAWSTASSLQKKKARTPGHGAHHSKALITPSGSREAALAAVARHGDPSLLRGDPAAAHPAGPLRLHRPRRFMRLREQPKGCSRLWHEHPRARRGLGGVAPEVRPPMPKTRAWPVWTGSRKKRPLGARTSANQPQLRPARLRVGASPRKPANDLDIGQHLAG